MDGDRRDALRHHPFYFRVAVRAPIAVGFAGRVLRANHEGRVGRAAERLLHSGQCWRQRGLSRGNALLSKRNTLHRRGRGADIGPGRDKPVDADLECAGFQPAAGRYLASIDFSNAANLSLVTTRQLVLTVVPSVAHDFNGDGFGDLVWRDTNANLAIWLMQGPRSSRSSSGRPSRAILMIAGQRDFNGDAKSDWLTRDTEREHERSGFSTAHRCDGLGERPHRLDDHWDRRLQR